MLVRQTIGIGMALAIGAIVVSQMPAPAARPAAPPAAPLDATQVAIRRCAASLTGAQTRDIEKTASVTGWSVAYTTAFICAMTEASK
jgi:hypothetical protein